ncbi:lysosome-associated membrane glycoprotein 1-like [Diadema setosum]|uniref:lysosome-associated membrane glycoprotein 1-like n=1 Tax=Diadema setosum TaxID=31175 RepID=UPI003B3A8B51
MRLTCTSLILLVGLQLAFGQFESNGTSTTVGTEAPTEILTGSVMTTALIETTTAPQTTPMKTTMAPRHKFVVNDSKGDACIMEEIKASFVIQYQMTNGDGKVVEDTVNFELPQNAEVDHKNSSCGGQGMAPKMTLLFGNPTEGNYFVQEFTMSANNSALTYVSLALKHTQTRFPNSTQAGDLVQYSAELPNTTFEVSNGDAFVCHADQTFKLSNATATFSDVRVQTAGIVNKTFGEGVECAQDSATTSVTTTEISTTTPHVTTLPPAHFWEVKGDDGKVCMMFNMSVEFKITYNTTKNKENTATITLPVNADPSSSVCSNTSASFVLTFFENTWQMKMDFMYYNDTKKYNNTGLSLHFVYDNNLPDAKKKGQNMTVTFKDTHIEAERNTSYQCIAEQKYTAGPVEFVFSDAKMQPFAEYSDGKMGSPSPCPADTKFNNIVPIAVGCALAGLVIIVLIAYLIGRQRSSKTGYESV